MTWMLTYTGAVFNLRYLGDGSNMSLLDIAAALSKINRFTGHTNRLYSVAEHSLHVCHVMERDLHVTDSQVLLAGLMHDAHEAYIGDMTTPLKRVLDDYSQGAWARLEHMVELAVQDRFGFAAAACAARGQVKEADLIMLATERRYLLPPTGPAWNSLQGVPHALGIDLGDYDGMGHEDWRDAFVERFGELQAGISLSRQPVRPRPPPDTDTDNPTPQLEHSA